MQQVRRWHSSGGVIICAAAQWLPQLKTLVADLAELRQVQPRFAFHGATRGVGSCSSQNRRFRGLFGNLKFFGIIFIVAVGYFTAKIDRRETFCFVLLPVACGVIWPVEIL